MSVSTRPPGVSRSGHLLKQLCMSVYTQAMRPNNFNTQAKSLTGFGPASAADKYFKSVDPKVSSMCGRHLWECELFSCQDQASGVYKHLYCPPFVLAPPSQRSKKNGDAEPEKSTVSEKFKVKKKIKFNPLYFR